MKGTVYFIKCLHDKRIYVGSTNNYLQRKAEHTRDLIKNKHHCIHLQRYVNKYGMSNIYFEIKIECDNYLEVEQFYLDTISNKFNTSISATAPMLGKTHSKEFCKMQSEYMKLNNPVPKGSKRAKYIIDAMINGAKNRVRSEEEKHKRRNSLVNKKNVSLYNTETNEYMVFDSISTCSKYIGVSSQSVSFSLNNSKVNVKKIYKLKFI